MAAKLRKKKQAVVEDDSWSDWCSTGSEEYASEDDHCNSETSLEEEVIVGEIGDYYCYDSDDDVEVVDPNDKMYQRQLWMPHSDEKIKIRRLDMFTNKSQCVKVVRDNCV